MHGAAAVVLIAAIAVCQASGQQHSVSPDGRKALSGIESAAQLWLEDTRTHQRRLVSRITVQTMTVAWSPDSRAFIVNDRAVSDLENAWIYDAKTLERLDLRSRILAADPEAKRFVPTEHTAPHSYFHAIRWLDAQHVEAQLDGHTDGTRNGSAIRPGDCFDLRYRIGRNGGVEKLSQRAAPISDRDGCGSE